MAVKYKYVVVGVEEPVFHDEVDGAIEDARECSLDTGDIYYVAQVIGKAVYICSKTKYIKA